MKKVYILLALLCACIFTSCKDDDPVLTPLQTPSGEVYQATVSSLTFYWDKIQNATQYGYELKDSEGNVVAGDVTNGTTATFTGLKDNSTYTLDVWAYSEFMSRYKKSEVATMTGKTPAIVQLEAPSPAATVDGAATITWEAVPNATSYVYTCTSDNGTSLSGTTAETSITLYSLTTGIYSFSIKAVSDQEVFCDSEEATVSFKIEKKESWRVDGTFDDGAGNKWPVTMIAWINGTYTLKNWYNVEGYDLEFSINDDTTINILNAYEPNLPNIYVKTGLEGDDSMIQLYTAMATDGPYSGFTGTKSGGGPIYFYSYKTNNYATFTWTKDGSLLDDLVGTYSQNSTGSQIFDGKNWVDFDSTNDVVITKIDDKTVSVSGIMYEGSPINGTVDNDANTLTFEPQTWLDWYVFCVYGAPTEPVVATITGNKIIFSSWTAYYTDYDYSYVKDSKTILTKM